MLDEPQLTPIDEAASLPALKPMVAQCVHRITPGHRCGAPAMRGEYYCFHHVNGARIDRNATLPFELPAVTDRQSLRLAAIEIANRVAANLLDIRRAGAILYSLQIALSTFPPQPRPKAEVLTPDSAAPADPHSSASGRIGGEQEPPPSLAPCTRREPRTSSLEPSPMLTDEQIDEIEKEFILPGLNACATDPLSPTPRSSLEPRTSPLDYHGSHNENHVRRPALHSRALHRACPRSHSACRPNRQTRRTYHDDNARRHPCDDRT